MSKELILDLDTNEFVYYERKVVNRGRASDIISDLTNASEFLMPTIPLNTVYYRRKGESEVYGLYIPAGMYEVGFTITWGADGQTYDFQEIPIPRPARFVLIPIRRGRIISEQIRSYNVSGDLNDVYAKTAYLASEWLPNTYRGTGKLCGGNLFEELCRKDSLPMFQLINSVSDFLSRSFYNHHLNDFPEWTPSGFTMATAPDDILGQYEGNAVWDQLVRITQQDRHFLSDNYSSAHALTIVHHNRMGIHWMNEGGLPLVKQKMNELAGEASQQFTSCTVQQAISSVESSVGL